MSMSTSPITFTSSLVTDYREDLESLMFLNDNQGTVQSGILRAIEQFGQPRLVTTADGLLRLRVDGLEDVQALYALERGLLQPNLVGVMVYARTDLETIWLLHIAVTESHSASAGQGGNLLALQFINQLRQIAHRIRGVKQLMVIYGSDQPWRIRVRGAGKEALSC